MMANEKRLIDANLLEVAFGNAIKSCRTDLMRSIYSVALKAVNDCPTVDAVEVVRGRWVQKEFWLGGGTWRCSECGYQVMFMEDTPTTKAMHYCPNCGAKMDGGNGNECS